MYLSAPICVPRVFICYILLMNLPLCHYIITLFFSCYGVLYAFIKMWRSDTLLDNQCLNKGFTREIKKYLEPYENRSTTYRNL